MDANYFLGERLDFTKNFYAVGSEPFLTIKHQIEDGLAPYEPPCSEDADPPFEREWKQANDSLVLLGGACISMVAASLHVFLSSLVKLAAQEDQFEKTRSKNGWWGKHQVFFKAVHSMDFNDSGCDMALLEEIVLARNRVQHPDNLTGISAEYMTEDLEKVSSPIFVSPSEMDVLNNLSGDDSSPAWFFPPTVYVDAEKLNRAIEEVRKFGRWLAD